MNGVHCAFTGRLSRDPESKYTSTSRAMLTLSVAVDENTRQTEQRPEVETTCCRVVCWEELADQIAAQLHKGSLVYVEGRLRLERWTAQDGQQRSGLSCSAWTVTPMGQIGQRTPQRDKKQAQRQPTSAGSPKRCSADDLDLPF